MILKLLSFKILKIVLSSNKMALPCKVPVSSFCCTSVSGITERQYKFLRAGLLQLFKRNKGRWGVMTQPSASMVASCPNQIRSSSRNKNLTGVYKLTAA